MNKLSRIAIASLALAAVSAPASAFIDNWYLSVPGNGVAGGPPPGGSVAQVNEYLDFIGNSFIQNSFTSSTNFNFTDSGTFNITDLDGGATIGGSFPGYEMTAMFQGATGSGVLNGNLTFNPGGTITFYSDHISVTGTAYGTAAGSSPAGAIYGANNGTVMGTFTQVSGTGTVNTSGIPNGLLTLVFTAKGTALTCGYWFDPAGNDLCGTNETIGFVTSNASLVANASLLLTQEVVCQEEGFGCPDGTGYNNAPTNFLVSNNGQFRLNPTPEPGTIALLGLGLAGLGLGRRFRRA